MSKNPKKTDFILTKKDYVFRFLVSFVPSVLALCFMIYFSRGPRLGFFFDFLQEHKINGETSKEILLIDTKNKTGKERNLSASSFISALQASSLITTLTELDANTLLIEVPVLGVSSTQSINETELLFRFDEEFNIISGNIKNLFNGIRFGSISPLEAGSFVQNVLSLTEQSKNKLLQAAVQNDAELAMQLQKTKRVFGDVFILYDIYADSIRAGNKQNYNNETKELETQNFIKAVPDADGIVRRIPLVLKEKDSKTYEHLVFAALKDRLKDTQAIKDAAYFLEISSKDFYLNKEIKKEIIFEVPDIKNDFRTIQFEDILDYAELDKMLYRLMSEAPLLAGYCGIVLENYPPFLQDKSKIIFDALLENPDAALRDQWIEARNNYFNSLALFFDIEGTVQNKIVQAFTDLKDNENLSQNGLNKLEAMKNEQLLIYTTANELYKNLILLRDKLKKNLQGSFCIAGDISYKINKDSMLVKDTTCDVYTSALLANSLLTENFVRTESLQRTLLFSLIAIFTFLIICNACNFFSSLAICIFAPILNIAVFAYSFILTSLWIDPFIPAVSVLTGTAASALFVLVIINKRAMGIRRAIDPFVPQSYIKPVIKENSFLEKDEAASACIVVVRNPDLSSYENRLEAKDFSRMQKEFRETISKIFLKGGAVIIGCGSDSIIFAFGSPPELSAASKTKRRLKQTSASQSNPVDNACKTVGKLYKNTKDQICCSCRCGIDAGECVFSYSRLTGYTAAGSPVLRARVLSTLTVKSNVNVLISKYAADKIDTSMYKALKDGLSEKTSGGEDLFYELLSGHLC
ncbi:MAG: hypothetical protein Ta2B_28150 [Termitinemataceae bacterium]|nr:MAG: hypothetical protein Ta2B_28150 [Termitinemataceae bacterium]